MKNLTIPYKPVSKTEKVLSSKPHNIVDKGKYIILTIETFSEDELEDEKLGTINVVEERFDSRIAIFKDSITHVESFYSNELDYYIVNINYGNSGTSFGIDTKEVAEKIVDDILNMILQ